MRVYFDSSAFAKRYINEPGTAEVLVWCDQATELALSVIAISELISALKREGTLSAGQYRRLKSDLMADIADALICDTTPQMIQAFGASSLDAISTPTPAPPRCSVRAWMPN